MSFEKLIARTSPPPNYRKYEKYYDGSARLPALGVTLPPQMRVLEQMAPFPKLAIDTLTEVLIPEGFILGDDSETPELLRQWWADNDMDATFQMAATEALVQGAAYFIIGPGINGGTPRIAAVSRDGVATRLDHFGRVAEAVVRYRIDDVTYATHYEAGKTSYLRQNGGQWRVIKPFATGVDVPTIVPMFNKERLSDTRGRSELAQLITVTDAASRTLTNLQVAQELLAMPMRYIIGDGITDAAHEAAAEQGITLEQAKFKSYIGILQYAPTGSEFGQLPGADLSSIINTYKMYASEVSAITGIPPAMLGISTDNPTSAEAIRVAKDRLIQRAESKSRMFGDALEEVFRIALQMKGVEVDNIEALEMRWRDPATASESARAQYLLQAHAQGVISAETAREGLRLTPQQAAREMQLAERFNTSQLQLGA